MANVIPFGADLLLDDWSDEPARQTPISTADLVHFRSISAVEIVGRSCEQGSDVSCAG